MLGYCSWWHKRRLIHRREIIDSLVDDLREHACPDHIAVTGDLTHLGLPMEYAEVGQWLPSLGSPEQVTVIPGNHEAYWGKDWLDSCAMWAPYLESDTTQRETSKTADLFPSVRIRGQVALIGLCFSDTQPAPASHWQPRPGAVVKAGGCSTRDRQQRPFAHHSDPPPTGPWSRQLA